MLKDRLMDSKRRILLRGLAATLAVPVAVGRARAVEAGGMRGAPIELAAHGAGTEARTASARLCRRRGY